MAGFLNPLKMEDTGREVGGRTVYRLLERVCFHVGQEDSALVICVPEGYEFDGASTPRILWSIVEPLGKQAKPACLHDWLYAGGVSRFIADCVFREALVVVGVPFWKTWLVWLAVRLFGGSHYRVAKNRRSRKKGQ